MEYKEIAAAILTAAIIKQSSKQSDKLVNYACDTYKEILGRLENVPCEKTEPNESPAAEQEQEISEEPKKKRKSKSKNK